MSEGESEGQPVEHAEGAFESVHGQTSVYNGEGRDVSESATVVGAAQRAQYD